MFHCAIAMLHWFTFIDPGSDFTTVVSLVSDFVSV